MKQKSGYFKSYYAKNRERRLAIAREYYKKNRLIILERTNKYKRDNPGKVNLYNRAYEARWRAEHKDLAKAKRRKYGLAMYGMNEEAYVKMSNSQCGVCAICSGDSGFNGRLHVDHDHTSKSIRGLLCSKCNLAIGLFDDDVKRIMKAMEYLKTNMNPICATEFKEDCHG